MPSVCLAFANGCPRSRVDTVLLERYFLANGWEICPKLKWADVIVVFTCGFSQRSETKSLNMLRIARAKGRPDATLVVAGCLPGINPAALAEFNAVLLPPLRFSDINQIAPGPVHLEEVEDPNDVHEQLRSAQCRFSYWERLRAEWDLSKMFCWRVKGLLGGKRPVPQDPVDPGVFCLRVAHSCRGECAFCAIPHASGPLRSKPLPRIISEFDRGLREGYRYFTLIAGDLGAYGQDIGLNVSDLMRELMSRPGDFILHCKELNPQWLIRYQQELLALCYANAHRLGTMMIPLQSGSEAVLCRMRRGHTARDLRTALRELRRACPGIAVDTHVLVGFPGETDEDFQQTLAFLRENPFRRIETYLYEDRPATEASGMPDKVARSTVIRRATQLRREFRGIARVCY